MDIKRIAFANNLPECNFVGQRRNGRVMHRMSLGQHRWAGERCLRCHVARVGRAWDPKTSSISNGVFDGHYVQNLNTWFLPGNHALAWLGGGSDG